MKKGFNAIIQLGVLLPCCPAIEHIDDGMFRSLIGESKPSNPYVNNSTPLREVMRNKHEGVTITIQLLDFQKNYYLPKFRAFERLTGATVKEAFSTTETLYSDISDDISNHNPGFIDLYSCFGNWVPQFVEMGGLKDISEDVSEVGLDWFDIMPAVRMGVATYEQKTYAVPVDGDVIIMLYRTDLVEGVGLPTPRTWDDVETILDFYEGKDINGDGIADYGNCFATKKDNIADKMFWSIAASFLQTQGTSQGAFFDSALMKPISSNPKFIGVLKIFKKLVLQSPFRDNKEGVRWQETSEMFQNKECVLFYNYVGPIKQIIGNQKERGLSGMLSILPLPGMKCSEDELCPHKSSYGANHAPFLAGGGFAYAVNGRISEEKQKAVIDFAFYISDPAVSFWDVAHTDSFLDPLRMRHTASLSNNQTAEAQAFLAFGWEERQLQQLKSVTEFNFLSPNYVLDLRIQGAEEYQEHGTIGYLIEMCNNHATPEETAVAITKSWEEVTKKYGFFTQREMYRKTLGLPQIVDKNDSFLRMIAIPFVVVFILLVAVVFKQRYTIKYRTRDVASAPKTGDIVLIFTDVEGSTALWDSSKSTMAKALRIHHDVIRSCIDKYNAYEVKTIGDAFMIALNDADRAVQLANDIQVELLNANWPAELAELPSSCVEYFPPSRSSAGKYKIIFRGLRVRIGVHMGEHVENLEEGGQVQVMYDKVAKGYDYYGPVTNTAARIEAAGFGGQTLISSEVCSKLSVEVKEDCALVAVGAIELRGVSQQMFLYQCLPKELKERTFDAKFRKRPSTVPDAYTAADSYGDIFIKSLRISDAEELSAKIMLLDSSTPPANGGKRLSAQDSVFSTTSSDTGTSLRPSNRILPRSSLLSLGNGELEPPWEGEFEHGIENNVNDDDLSYGEEDTDKETDDLLKSHVLEEVVQDTNI